jgi:Zn-dependent protease
MLGKRFVLFELLGFKVQIDASWLFLAMLVTWSLAKGVFPAWYEGLSTTAYWWMAVAGVIGLVFSLIFHELSHSLVARHFGLPIRGITLFIFGGVAEMEEEPASAKVEFLMAVAGPIASGVFAVGFYLIAIVGMAQGLPAPVLGILDYLALINSLLAAFNLLPAFPLDGGRMLRAALWHFKGDLREATRIASRSGEIFGMVLMALGAVNVVAGNFIGGMWWFLIGLFLYAAARASYVQLLNKRAFEGEPVRRFMTPDPVTIDPETTLDSFVMNCLYHSHHGLYPVVDSGRLIGCIGARQITGVPREDWGIMRVGEVFVRSTPENTISADTDSVKAMAMMRHSATSRLMVADGERLVGIITLKDMLDLFALKMELEGPP